MHSSEDSNDVLCDGLRWLSPPVPSSDFDDRVIAALRQPGSWREALLRVVQPALSGMCCSVLATLAVIYWTVNGPASFPVPRLPAMPTAHVNMALLDMILDEPTLRADSLEQLSRVSSAAAPLPVEPVHRPPDIRHACLPRKTAVTC